MPQPAIILRFDIGCLGTFAQHLLHAQVADASDRMLSWPKLSRGGLSPSMEADCYLVELLQLTRRPQVKGSMPKYCTRVYQQDIYRLQEQLQMKPVICISMLTR